jgi:non-heme chloroperoxidase
VALKARGKGEDSSRQRRIGMQDTIVMIHGMWSDDTLWDGYKGYFETKGYRCVVPVLRYHKADPLSEPHPEIGRTSLLDYQEDVERELQELTSRPILMGHSMGGLLAQMLAAKGLAKAIVLLAPAPPSGLVVVDASVAKACSGILKTWGFWHKPIRQTPEQAASYLFNLLPDDQKQRRYEKLVPDSGRAFFEFALWYFDKRRASSVDESRVTCPVLVVAGAQDRMTPAPLVEKVANKYRTVSTYKEFANHAHWLLEEPEWDEVAGYVSDWLHETLVQV